MLKLLIVEDDKDDIRVLLDGIQARDLDIEVTIAASRDSAVARCTQDSFDLAICDLKIPTVDEGLDAEVDHGFAAFLALREHLAGMPVIMLSAFGTLETAERILAEGLQDDPFGLGTPEPMVHSIQKRHLNQCIDRVVRTADHIRSLESIEVIGGVDISEPDKRLVQIFARKYSGTSVELRQLQGGMSATRTIVARVLNDEGVLTARAFLKLGKLSLVEEESARYGRHVPVHLAEGAFVPQAELLRAGAGGNGAVVFTLADDHVPLFEVLQNDQARSVLAVGVLQERLKPWMNGAGIQAATVREIREPLLPDDQMAEIDLPDDIHVDELESLIVNIRRCVQHGDLHGLNVLVDAGGSPKLIDFGRTGPGTGALDAVTLELSLVFHPAGREACDGWPTPEDLALWSDLDRFLEHCPCPEFVRAARSWAENGAGSPEEILSTAYSIACRHLRFSDTSREHALALIRHCSAELVGKATH